MILLDTHVVLWLAFEPEKVSATAYRKIAEARRANEGLAVSGITLLELAKSATKGRFNVAMTIEAFLAEIEATFRVLPITSSACGLILKLPANYPKDPADRVIGATAIAQGMTLITADRNILASKAVPAVW